jgi:SAM-dependent methyltransferase
MTSEDYFRTRFTPDARRTAVWKEISRFIQARDVPRHARILELGAGYCDFINQIEGRERHALDVADSVRRHAADGVVVHVGSCTSLSPFADKSLDVVFASNLFEHLTREELSATLAEVRRVLVPDGRLIVLQPNFRYCSRRYFDDYTHLQVFSHVSLADRLSSAGFQILRVEPRFMPFSLKSRVPAAPLLVRLYLWAPFRPGAGQMLLVARPGAAPGAP